MFKKIGSTLSAPMRIKGTLKKASEVLTLEAAQDWKSLIVSASENQDDNAKPLEVNVDDARFDYYRARAVSAGEIHGPNGNGDYFPSAELEKYHKTFIRRGIYLEHNSENFQDAVGIIVDAEWHPKDGYVEILYAIDKRDPRASKIVNGSMIFGSMGALVQESECSECGKRARAELDYCDHLRNHLGRTYNGRPVYSKNYGINFYEWSYVGVPADKDAAVLEKVASEIKKLEDLTLEELQAARQNFANLVKTGFPFPNVEKEIEKINARIVKLETARDLGRTPEGDFTDAMTPPPAEKDASKKSAGYDYGDEGQEEFGGRNHVEVRWTSESSFIRKGPEAVITWWSGGIDRNGTEASIAEAELQVRALQDAINFAKQKMERFQSKASQTKTASDEPSKEDSKSGPVEDYSKLPAPRWIKDDADLELWDKAVGKLKSTHAPASFAAATQIFKTYKKRVEEAAASADTSETKQAFLYRFDDDSFRRVVNAFLSDDSLTFFETARIVTSSRSRHADFKAMKVTYQEDAI